MFRVVFPDISAVFYPRLQQVRVRRCILQAAVCAYRGRGITLKHTTGFTSSARYRCLEDLQREAVELCLIYCGWEYCDPGHRFGPNIAYCEGR